MSEDSVSAGDAPATRPPDRPVAPLLAWLPWIAAVGFALLLGFLGQAYFSARAQMAALRVQAALADIECRSLRQQIEAERILSARRQELRLAGDRTPEELAQLRVVPLFAGTDARAPVRAVVVWDPARQEGELAAFLLPALPSGQCYRVDVTGPSSADPVAAGTFTVKAPEGDARMHLRPARPVADANRFTVSIAAPDTQPPAPVQVVFLSR